MNNPFKFAVASATASLLLVLSAQAAQGLKGGPHDFSSTGEYQAGASGNLAKFTWGGATANAADATTSYSNPCQVCHIPHKAPNAGSTQAPLWNHAMDAADGKTVKTYVTYEQGNSARFASLGIASSSFSLGASTACLSCHDGSVAINQQYAKSTGYVYTGGAADTTKYYVPTFAVEANTDKTTQTFTSATGTAPYTTSYGSRLDLTHMHPIGISYTDALVKDDTLQAVSGTIMGKMLKGPNKTVECSSCHDIHRVVGDSGSGDHNHALIVNLDGALLCATCHKQVSG